MEISAPSDAAQETFELRAAGSPSLSRTRSQGERSRNNRYPQRSNCGVRATSPMFHEIHIPSTSRRPKRSQNSPTVNSPDTINVFQTDVANKRTVRKRPLQRDGRLQTDVKKRKKRKLESEQSPSRSMTPKGEHSCEASIPSDIPFTVTASVSVDYGGSVVFRYRDKWIHDKKVSTTYQG